MQSQGIRDSTSKSASASTEQSWSRSGKKTEATDVEAEADGEASTLVYQSTLMIHVIGKLKVINYCKCKDPTVLNAFA